MDTHNNDSILNFSKRFFLDQSVDGTVNEMEIFTEKEGLYVGVYSGDVKNGYPEGSGNISFKNRDEYFGQFSKGYLDGKGVLHCQDGDKYTGTFKQGKKEKGKMVFSNGDIYEGEWENDNKHGYGILTDINGTYEGMWRRDEYYGTGKLTFQNGDVYEGEWNEMSYGKGTIHFANGNVYEGEWNYEDIHGRGKMTWVNGDVYEGEWELNCKHGFGKMIKSNGEVLEGMWQNDQFIDNDTPDPLFTEAAKLVVKHQQGSTSLIQRQLEIGYNRASHLIYQLEDANIVGPFEGTKARQVLFADLDSLQNYLKEYMNL